LVAKRLENDSPLRLLQHGAHLFLGLPLPEGTSTEPYPHNSPYFRHSWASFRNWDAFVTECVSWGEDLPQNDEYNDWRLLANYFGSDLEATELAEKLVKSQVQLPDLIASEGQLASATTSIPHQVSSFRISLSEDLTS